MPPGFQTRRFRGQLRILRSSVTLNIENLYEKMTKRVIALFDVDGTLTVPRKAITQEMHDFMKELQVLTAFNTVLR